MTPHQPDEPWEDDRDRQRYYGSNVVNGNGKWTDRLLTMLSLLIVAGICGEVALYGQVKALQSTMDLIVAGKIVIVHVP